MCEQAGSTYISLYVFFFFYTGKPGPPVNVCISHYTPDSVTLQWDPPEYNGGSPVKYVVEKKSWIDDGRTWSDSAEETSQQSFTFDNLSQSDEYQFRVCSVNKIGRSESVINYIKEMSKLNN